MEVEQPITVEAVARKLSALSPNNLTEVARFIDYVQFRSDQGSAKRSLAQHPAFGIWADREEIEDTVKFARELRRKVERHQDRDDSHAID
jgi:hypothetical protein